MLEQQYETKSNFIRALMLTFLLLHGMPAGQAPKSAQIARSADSNVENNSWQVIFFREIDERAKLANLDQLRDTILQADDLELRIWIGFGPVPLKGFVIKRRASEWSAIYLRSITPSVAHSDYKITLGRPKSGWDTFWKRLIDNEVLSMKSTMPSGWVDGESFVVEIKTRDSYKTYMIDNPELSKRTEGRRMIEIVRIIRGEFDIPK